MKPLAPRPIVLSVASGAIDVLQVAVIKRLERDHPRWALTWAAALVAVEGWATTK